MSTHRDYYDNGINLDAIPEDDLREFAKSMHYLKRQEAALIFPGKPKGYVKASHMLENYAWNKLTAMILRKEGEINRAIEYENICQRIYDRLPEFARW